MFRKLRTFEGSAGSFVARLGAVGLNIYLLCVVPPRPTAEAAHDINNARIVPQVLSTVTHVPHSLICLPLFRYHWNREVFYRYHLL